MGNFKDISGQKFGRLTVIKRSYPNNPQGTVNWLCKCICGKEKIIRGHSLRDGETKSCGCIKNIDLTGYKFGKLTVIKRVYPISGVKWKQKKWLCRCDCGKEKIILGDSIKYGHTKSCGCICKTRGRRSLKIGIASMRQKIGSYKRRAKENGLDYRLTDEQFVELTQQDCHYCGAKPNNISNSFGNGIYIYNGLDRVDNNKGYTIDNVVPCCKHCNMAKNTFTQQEFKDWIEKIYNKMFL